MTDQAAMQSADSQQTGQPINEDSLASMFRNELNGEQPQGDAETDQGETGQPGADESSAEVEGEQAPAKFKVPALEGDGFDELTAEELKAQRLMQSDYTRKTQALAEERKAIAAERNKVEQEISQRVGTMEAHLTSLGHAIQSFDQQVDWDQLRQIDPAAYLEAREQQQARLQAFERSRQQLEQVRTAQKQERIAANSQRLVEAMPELLDPKAAKQFAERIADDAQKNYGFSPQDIDAIDDYRVILALRDAAEYRALKAKAAEVKQKVAVAPQLARPGAPRQGNPQALDTYRTINKARQSGSIDDMAAAFLKAGV